ncbi:ATP-binding response regulator [Fulvivirga sediminis]|uniref:histidine kinase n=1 Tax=Fulvivirga sediminis TaxID=2803949 RepID=A0A937JZZ0_9BACT|nr:hybrid sensor histidine kinase/response regulator [Fulvivirga sediminis]MBL3655795.1 hybrid sensor histidine kinase/response regulator [Fulvivirga sediminis]
MGKNLLKILVVEDSLDDFNLIERELQKEELGGNIKRVITKGEYIQAIKEFHPCLIVCDHSLPQFTGIDALEICRNMGTKVPFILISGAVSEEYAVSCFKKGIDDYILKNSLFRLPVSIKNILKKYENIRQKKEYQKSLVRQNEHLKKINSELDNLVYSVSHKLRGPLATIGGIINVAQHEVEEANSKGDLELYFNLIKDRLSLMDRTIKQILEYSRNSRTEIEIEEVSISQLVGEVWTSISYLPLWNRVKLEMNIDPELSWRGDKHRFMVIINNLLVNAVKFADHKKAMNRVKIEALEDESRLKVFIEDNGIGIPEENISKIYDMFYRASEQGEGAGLGLYVVKEAVKKLEGSIKIQSEYRDGTKVTLNLPIHYKTINPTEAVFEIIR